jgi:hypothetical protein
MKLINTPSSQTSPQQPPRPDTPHLEMLPIYRPPVEAVSEEDTPCCGPPAGPPSSPHERPGFTLCPFVEGFIETPAGAVPQVKIRLSPSDRLGTLRVRLGLGRNDYKVAPGLYALGEADPDSPVVVTANYKLSFDHLRSRVGSAAWLLVLDTRGINVWCAAGKGSFGTQELIHQVWRTRLALVVRHRKLLLPQLGAAGVAARKVKKACGFEVCWGPVRAQDLAAFLAAGGQADEAMRQVTFTWRERLVLVPVELYLLRKVVLWAALAIIVISGIGPDIYGFEAAAQRGVLAVSALLIGVLSGAVAVPLLLPWLPGRAFAVKGAAMGALSGVLLLTFLKPNALLSAWSSSALLVLATTVSAYLAMNFTGATPFTSPSGVEKEMRWAMPLQLAALAAAAVLWLAAAFVK